MDSLTRLHNIYKDQFVIINDHLTPKFANSILSASILILLEKCEWNENRNASDRKKKKSGNILHIPFVSLLSHACSLNERNCHECEARIWELFSPSVVEKKRNKVINNSNKENTI